MKKVSVVIPIFNGQYYIEKCINSLEEQTYNNLEIICVNDGSQDKTIDILNNISKEDKRIIVINKKNEGVSKARNVGIKQATGDYITFVDIDDWIDKTWIESLINKIEEMKCDVVRGNYLKENKNGKIIQCGNLANLNNICLRKQSDIKYLKEAIVVGKIPAYSCLLLIKAEKIKGKVMFIDNIPVMEDTIFYIDLLNQIDSIYLYDLKGYHYILNGSSATQNPDLYWRNIDNIVIVNSILKEKVDKNILSKMNLVHIKAIREYIFKLYKYKRIKLFDIRNIVEQKKIINILKKIDYKDLADEKSILYIKEKCYLKIKIYFFLRKIISKIRDVFLGAR